VAGADASAAVDTAAAAFLDAGLAPTLSSLPAIDGRGVAAWLAAAARGGPDAPLAAAAARDAAWEQLHTGPWAATEPAWRDAYALACVLAAAGGGAAAALRAADSALLLGGEGMRPAAHALAAAAQAALDAARGGSHWADELPATFDGAARSALPPGALAHPLPPTPPPSLADFAARFLTPATPTLLAGLAATWPALTLWASPRFWARALGDRTLPVELGAHYMEEGWGQALMEGRAFVRGCWLREEEGGEGVRDAADAATASPCPPRLGYLAQHDLLAQVPALRADVVAPDYCALSIDRGSASPPTTNLWLGPAGTVTPPHTDPHHNLLVQVVGRKYVRLWRPAAGRALAPGAGAAGLTPNTSRVDVRTLVPAPGAPGAAGEPYVDALLAAGDAIFIPRGWWHFVLAATPSASVSFWWD